MEVPAGYALVKGALQREHEFRDFSEALAFVNRVGRLAEALRGHDGLESANANLVGDVTLSWDERRTTREEILVALARAGFHEAPNERE